MTKMREPLAVREAPAKYQVVLEAQRVRPGYKCPKGYKQTEVGVIPEDWYLKSVGDIATTVASGRSRVDSEFGDYPVYGSTGIIGRCTHGNYFGRAILIARVGANAGKLSVVDGDYGVTDNTIMVKIDSSFHMDYFWRQLEAKRLNTMVFGSGQPLITGTQIKSLAIPFPPTKAEQEAIAEALSDADALIESLEQLIAKKRHLKQGAMQELLTGKKRLPGFSGEWEVKRLGELAELKNGYAFKSSTYTDLGQFKVVTIANVQDGYMSIGECNKINSVPYDIQAHQKLCRGDILISMTGNVGRVCRVIDDDCLLNQRVGKLVSQGINDVFLSLLLSQRHFLASMTTKATGGAQGNLSVTDITEFEFSVPCEHEEQTAIATILSDMDTEITALETRLAKTRSLKQGMMHNLLTGKIRLV